MALRRPLLLFVLLGGLLACGDKASGRASTGGAGGSQPISTGGARGETGGMSGPGSGGAPGGAGSGGRGGGSGGLGGGGGGALTGGAGGGGGSESLEMRCGAVCRMMEGLYFPRALCEDAQASMHNAYFCREALDPTCAGECARQVRQSPSEACRNSWDPLMRCFAHFNAYTQLVNEMPIFASCRDVLDATASACWNAPRLGLSALLEQPSRRSRELFAGL